MTRARRTRARLLALALWSPILGMGCGQSSERGPEAAEVAPVEHPPGTVLVLDGEPILKSEIDELAALVAEIYPQYTRPQHRRLALTNGLLALRALRHRHAAAREASLRSAQAACVRSVPGAAEPAFVLAEGTWRNLGFELWSQLRRNVLDPFQIACPPPPEELEAVTVPLSPDAWLGPFEIPGRHLLVKIHERPPEGSPQARGWKVAIAEFPYLPSETREQAIADAIDASTLEIVDPAWDEVVPEEWKHRMSGGL